MADLSTNYIDDILAESMNGKRKYRITRADGSFEEVTLEDVSEYEQRGSVFGAGDINRTNQAVNEKFDSGDVVDPMETTIPGFAADALAVKNQFNEQNKNLDGIGEAVLLAEVSANKTQTFTNIDITPYKSVLVHGWKNGANNILQLIGHGSLPTNLMTVNTRIITKYYAGGTDNEHTVTRTGDKSFTLYATGADNYGTRFYGIK